MNRLRAIIVGGSLAVIAAAGGFLLHLKAHQRLGEPGIRCSPTTNGLRMTIALPDNIAGYTSTNVEPSDLERQVLPADTSLARRLYRSADGTIEILLGVVMMGTDRTSIHKPEYCLTSQGWQIVGRETVSMTIDQPQPYTLPVRQFTTSRLARLADGRQAQWSGVYLFWFVADGRLTASHWGRVGWLTWDLLRKGVLPRWAYVSAFVACQPGQEERASAMGREFLRTVVPQFQLTTGAPEASDR